MTSQSSLPPPGVFPLELPEAEGVAAVRWAARSCRFSFRGDAEAARAAGIAFGAPLPAVPMQSARQLLSAALWLGPDEWLLLGPLGEAAHLASAITRALASTPHALVDISARNAGLVVTGPLVEAVLSAGCPLDLDRNAFPVGACTRTLLAKAEVVLWRTAVDAFRLEVARSYAPYVIGLLAEAIRNERAMLTPASPGRSR
jgi:sarcosine oxidase subunit gamma